MEAELRPRKIANTKTPNHKEIQNDCWHEDSIGVGAFAFQAFWRLKIGVCDLSAPVHSSPASLPKIGTVSSGVPPCL
jgi:hypothetical protein